MTHYKEVHWSVLHGNKYATKLHFKMLTNEGFKQFRKGKTKDQSPLDNNKQLLLITFDKAYVVTFLIIKLIIPLNLSKEKLISLIEIAYQEYEKITSEKLW